MPDGFGPAFGMRADVAAQILRSVRMTTMAALVFLAPGKVLAGTPFELKHIPRLLDTAWHVTLALSLILLMRRKGAVVATWTQPDGFPRRFWNVFGPIFSIALVLILFMDMAGYRVGASYLMANVVRTIGAFLGLAWLYRILVGGAARIASMVRKRVVTTDGAAAAWESSSAVVSQLTRLAATVISVAAVVALLQFWGIDQTAFSVLDGVKIVEVRDGVDLTLWNVAIAFLWVIGGHVLTGNLAALYEFVVFPLIGQSDRGGRFVVLALSRYAILFVAYSAALLSLQFSFTSIGWLLTAASVGLGFGLQEIVANFVSGLILLIERPVRVGDIVEVGTTSGTVERIQIRATTITNWDRKTIIVPNKTFITQELTNWTRNDDVMRRRFQISTAYGTDTSKVLAIISEVIAAHEKVLKDPPHRVWLDSFADSGIVFDVWFFALIPDGFQALTDIRTGIYQRFNEEGIEIPFPQRDVHIKTADDLAGLAGLLDRPKPDASEPES